MLTYHAVFHDAVFLEQRDSSGDVYAHEEFLKLLRRHAFPAEMVHGIFDERGHNGFCRR